MVPRALWRRRTKANACGRHAANLRSTLQIPTKASSWRTRAARRRGSWATVALCMPRRLVTTTASSFRAPRTIPVRLIMDKDAFYAKVLTWLHNRMLLLWPDSTVVVAGDLQQSCGLQGPHVPGVGLRLFAVLVLLCDGIARPHCAPLVKRAHHPTAHFRRSHVRCRCMSRCVPVALSHDASELSADAPDALSSSDRTLQSCKFHPNAHYLATGSSDRTGTCRHSRGSDRCVDRADDRSSSAAPAMKNAQCACGTCNAATLCVSLPATRARCMRWRFPRMAALWPLPVRTLPPRTSCVYFTTKQRSHVFFALCTIDRRGRRDHGVGPRQRQAAAEARRASVHGDM